VRELLAGIRAGGRLKSEQEAAGGHIMRIALVAFVLAAASAAGAVAQPRVLTVQDETPPPAVEPAPPVPPAAVPAAPAPQTLEPVQTPPGKIQDQLPAAVAEREDRIPPPPARFSFNQVYDGYLRLDRESGEVAFCRPDAGGWTCETVPYERATLEKELEALREEIGALKREIAALRAPPPPPPAPKPAVPKPAAGQDGVTIKLPDKRDFARARDFLQDTWRRLVDMIQHWQKDVMDKG
jgi:hypothetical protein